jgi:hypothetical protein
MVEMIDVVYFLTPDKFYQHHELLYSLRSLEKHVTGVGQVFVMGAPVSWPTEHLEQIPECDPYDHNKDANIIRKMRIVSQWKAINNPFLFVNDDHYFSQDCRAEDFPFYHKGEIKAFFPQRDYQRRLANTRAQLAARGGPTLNYDVHAPILIDQRKFLEVFDRFDWVDLDGPGVVMKSIYVNSCPELAAAGIYLPDCKLSVRTAGGLEGWLERLRERPCWSTGNYIPRLVWQMFERLYPEPSIYEKEPFPCL